MKVENMPRPLVSVTAPSDHTSEKKQMFSPTSGEGVDSFFFFLERGAGENFSISIKCDDAWGQDREDLFIEFDKKVFLDEDGVDEEVIAEGEIVPMEDDEGNEVMGVVVENKDKSIVLDLNHPMAGEDVHFEGTVLEVSDPQNN